MKDDIYTDIMVDLETTHIQPDSGAILQIAAVKFNLEKRIVCPDYFDRCLTIPNHRSWSESTRTWWVGKRLDLLNELVGRAEPWRPVTEAFVRYAYPPGQYRFWSKPSHFDFQFIQSYVNDIEMPQPFAHWEANDLRSFLRGGFFPEQPPKIELEFVGEVHNALWDTFHQIKMLFAYADLMGRPKQEILPPEPCTKQEPYQAVDFHTRTGDV